MGLGSLLAVVVLFYNQIGYDSRRTLVVVAVVVIWCVFGLCNYPKENAETVQAEKGCMYPR